MNEDITQLELVRITEKGFLHIVGKDGVVEIHITNDGRGPMGFYDRIHVFIHSENDERILDEHRIYPAHMCLGWKVLEIEDVP